LLEKSAAPAAIRHSRSHSLFAIITAVCLRYRTVRYIAGEWGIEVKMHKKSRFPDGSGFFCLTCVSLGQSFCYYRQFLVSP